jgi:predicted DNA-binding transcriptional regulator YafY
LFAALNEACSSARAVRIEYRSMTNPQGLERVIEPHSLIHIGRRWHVRAWCRLREGFSDFNLGRIRSARLLDEPCQRASTDDIGWTILAKVWIAPHRALTAERAEVVKAEMLGGADRRLLEVRSCLAAYAIQELRAATNIEIQSPPDYQIEVSNAADLKALLFESAKG